MVLWTCIGEYSAGEAVRHALLDPFVDKLREGCDLVLLETLSDLGRGFDVYRFSNWLIVKILELSPSQIHSIPAHQTHHLR